MRTSKREQRLFSDFERPHGLLASYGGKVFEELFEGVSSLEVIDQVLDRHSSAREHGRSTLNIRI